MVNVILCGGTGSRLWPLSRTQLPKQFARILPGDTLFEATVRRNMNLSSRFLIASNKIQITLAESQMKHVGVDDWDAVIEPIGRNTAPAIALACMMLDPEEIVLVTPSDHYIALPAAYETAVGVAEALALDGRLVTFGIQPSYPETGFGYIQAKPGVAGGVRSFTEKPNAATAAGYIASGDYYWNSGMFCFQSGVLLDELLRLNPGLHEACAIAYESCKDDHVLRPSLKSMEVIPSVSIDHAVMEKSDRLSFVPCNIGWSDLGSFDALFDHLVEHEKTIDGNACISSTDPIHIGDRNNLVINDKPVVLIDVEDLIVVERDDALLLARRGSSQKLRQAVKVLESVNPTLLESSGKTFMSWGTYEVVHREKNILVLRLLMYAGAEMKGIADDDIVYRLSPAEGQVEITTQGTSRVLAIGGNDEVPSGAEFTLRNTGHGNLVLLVQQHCRGDSCDPGFNEI